MNPADFRKVREVFEATLERAPEERAAFLERACAGDEEVRREAAALLAAYREEDDFLERSVLAERSDPLAEGRQVGPYRVRREIGRGGMGVVYLAEDTRLNREVALKALTPELVSSPKQRERFRREAAVAASLSHPGIATIHALEEWDGRLYIVSEYVRGETLGAEIERGPFGVDAALDAALQLAESLAEAHKNGIVHRDLKPDNIVRDAHGRLKILDFGLAMVLERQFVETRLTEAGTVLGTPSYMSPEQLQSDPVDCRSDLFAFGIVIYELVSGRHPFKGKSSAVTMARILGSEAPRLEWLQNAAPGLERVIQRCLRKDAAERYQSARDLAADLKSLRSEAAGAGAAMSPGAASGRRLSHRWWVFHQIAVIIFYAAAAAGLWRLKALQPGVATLLPFIGTLACGVLNAILRIHLLFTANYNRDALAHEMRQTAPWVRRTDWAFTALLLAAAIGVSLDRQLIAGVLVGAAVGYLAVFLAVEPATVHAVFLEESRSDSPSRQ